jgi:hypothetical protein
MGLVSPRGAVQIWLLIRIMCCQLTEICRALSGQPVQKSQRTPSHHVLEQAERPHVPNLARPRFDGLSAEMDAEPSGAVVGYGTNWPARRY